MKFRLIIDGDAEEEITARVKSESHLTDEIRRLCEEYGNEIIGYSNNIAAVLSPADVCCFTVDGGKVVAVTENGNYAVKTRLYLLDERFGSFVYINQSCLANVKKIKRFDVSVGGSLRVTFVGGHTDYVSRRCLKRVKERFGIK